MRSLVGNLAGRSPDCIVCYYFYSEARNTRSHLDALSALLYQLLIHDPTLLRIAAESVKGHGTSIRSNLHAMWTLLCECSVRSGKVVICVLDALDESADTERLLLMSLIKRYYQADTVLPIRILITARPYSSANRMFGDFKTQLGNPKHLDGDKAPMGNDIVDFIDAKVHDMPIGPRTKQRLCTKLKERNLKTRSFLWLKLALTRIESQMEIDGAGDQELDECLDGLSDSIWDQYESLLPNATEFVRIRRARTLLGAVLAAERPLKLAELQAIDALARHPAAVSYEELELEDQSAFMRSVQRICGLLLTFDDNSYVYFFHQTVIEFLQPKSGQTSGLWKHTFRLGDIHSRIAEACMRLLSLQDFTARPLDIASSQYPYGHFIYQTFVSEVSSYAKGMPLLEYAASFWHKHQRLASDDVRPNETRILDLSSHMFWTWFTVAYWLYCKSKVRTFSLTADEQRRETARAYPFYTLLLQECGYALESSAATTLPGNVITSLNKRYVIMRHFRLVHTDVESPDTTVCNGWPATDLLRWTISTDGSKNQKAPCLG